MHLEIKPLKAEEVLPIRHSVLKPHLTQEKALEESDFAETTIHLGGFLDKELICVATFIKENHPHLESQLSYRLRGMATISKFRRQGFARAVLIMAEAVLLEKNVDLLWFNARVGAFEFYERMEFQYFGDFFELPQIGLHKVMYKYLGTR